jgi:hypothetical protein
MNRLLILLAFLIICSFMVSACGQVKSVTPEINATITAATPGSTPPKLSPFDYLKSNLNVQLKLIRESPDTGSPQDQTYWLANDNLLASYALISLAPELSKEIMSSIEAWGYKHDHYIEILFGKRTIEPTHAVDLDSRIVETGRTYIIKSEIVTDTVMQDYTEYFDKLCYETLWYAYGGYISDAEVLYNKAVLMWDGKGIKDKVYNPVDGYSTYKLALMYYTSRVLGKLDTLTFKDTLLRTINGLQNVNGGFNTFYDVNNTSAVKPRGSTNTETTSITLIALNYKSSPLPPPVTRPVPSLTPIVSPSLSPSPTPIILSYSPSSFSQTNSITTTTSPIRSQKYWVATINNTIQWGSTSNNPRVALGFFSSLARPEDPSIQIVEYKDGSLDVLTHNSANPNGVKISSQTLKWTNTLTISLISGKLLVSSSAGTFSYDFPDFSLAYVTAGSTESNICSGGEVIVKISP